MEDLIYLCESEFFTYYRNDYEEVIMLRNCDNALFSVSDVNEGELMNDIRNGSLLKLSPDFIYDYQEILKEQQS